MLSGTVLASAALASLLLMTAGVKAIDRPGAVVSLATYGLEGPAAARAWAALVVVEGLVAAGLLLGLRAAAVAGAALLAVFAGAQAAALLAGRGGAPCGCLGGRGRLSWRSVLRTGAIAVALALLVPAASPVAAAAAVAAAVAGACLLRPRRPAAALDVFGEGPQPGTHLDLPGEGERLALFTAAACGLCAEIRRGVGRVERLEDIVVVELDQDRHADIWRAAGIPGSPYAVVVGPAGDVRAKGAVNTVRQLRSLVTAARARHEESAASRRAFLRRAAGAAAAASVAPAVSSLVRPGEAEAYHFCGHIYTTDSCPHPTGLPRIDARGFPLRAADGHPVDDLGRPIDPQGRPLDAEGRALLDADGRPLPIATRTRVCTATARQFRIRTRVDGAWYRCCGGTVRKLVDCCSMHRRRINGDASLRGYCYGRRRVFCVMYYQTKVPC